MNMIRKFLGVLYRGGTFTVRLDGGQLKRARLAHERHQRAWEEANRDNPQDPVTFEECLQTLIEQGLEADENEHGLVGTVLGDVMTAAEYARRAQDARQRRLRREGP
jgi:hypothetical protein